MRGASLAFCMCLLYPATVSGKSPDYHLCIHSVDGHSVLSGAMAAEYLPPFTCWGTGVENHRKSCAAGEAEAA